MVLDNSSELAAASTSDEVTITRRGSRNGDSDYFLNGRRAKLRDIQTILATASVSQNSYAIIGQGLVESVLNLRAEDRRQLIEEAADIQRYRYKIEEAEAARSSRPRENVERVKLLVKEIAPRMGALERQATPRRRARDALACSCSRRCASSTSSAGRTRRRRSPWPARRTTRRRRSSCRRGSRWRRVQRELDEISEPARREPRRRRRRPSPRRTGSTRSCARSSARWPSPRSAAAILQARQVGAERRAAARRGRAGARGGDSCVAATAERKRLEEAVEAARKVVVRSGRRELASDGGGVPRGARPRRRRRRQGQAPADRRRRR